MIIVISLLSMLTRPIHYLNLRDRLRNRTHACRPRPISLSSISSSSSSLACPVIWSRRYVASSSILPCLLRCPLSTMPVSYLSYTHLSTLGLASLFFFSLVCLHLAFFSPCAPLSFSSHGRTTSVVFLSFS